MSKYCPCCRTENSDDALWCINCNAKLEEIFLINQDQESPPSENIEQKTKYETREDKEYLPFNHYEKTAVKIFAVILIICIVLTALFLYSNINAGSNFSGINCKLNEDFWFEGNYLNTSDGWTFKITKIKDYTLDGIILDLKTYHKDDHPYRPINVFSPIDLCIGVDNVKENPDKYPYKMTSFDDRVNYWVFNGGSTAEYNYFKTHTGNNHIIPHNIEVLNELNNISVMDQVVIEGSLVNLYGTRGNQYYGWDTDTKIGNYDCEIILVDSITINT